ncbi:MAG: hypothetical protein SGJ20_14250 [Planctomycetota bacterium]|nr:hypothetical protein [Planctomycetota bacterium]
MRWTLLAVILLKSILALPIAAHAADALPTPQTELAAALNDLRTVPPHRQPLIRYLSLYAVPVDRQKKVAATVSYLLNALSQRRLIARPVPVGKTLLRIELDQFTTNEKVLAQWIQSWDAMAAVEPYWHMQTESIAVTNNRKRIPQQTQVVTIDAPWIVANHAMDLRKRTGSIGALLRADYFVAIASLPPRYYELAGVPRTEQEFLKSLGVDSKQIEQLRASAGANLIRSNITQKPRRIIWQPGPLGGVYATLDVEKVTADRDPIRRAISEKNLQLQYDASEWFAMRANGLWVTALFDRAGRRQDSVPDRIAKDTSDPQGDGIVVPMLSCIRCHRQSGLQGFTDDQSRLLRSGVELRSTDRKIIDRVAEFYDEPRLQRQMNFDRELYAEAVKRATGGMKPTEIAEH